MASRQSGFRDQASHWRKQQTTGSHSLHWLHQLDNVNGSSHTCSPLDCLDRWVRPHMPPFSQIQWACYKKWKVEWEHLRRILWVYCPGHAWVKGNDRADRLAGKATITCGLRLRRSEVLRRWDITCRHKAIRTSHYRSPGGERRRTRKRSTLFLKRTWKDHRQSDQHWNYFKGYTGETQRETGWSVYGLSQAHRYHLERTSS